MQSSDAMRSGDARPPDHQGADAGSDGPAIRWTAPVPASCRLTAPRA